MTKFRGTKGEWIVGKNYSDKWIDIDCGKINISEAKNYGRISVEELYANAQLIADAGNTIQKCDLFPCQILEQRDELLEIVKTLSSKSVDWEKVKSDFYKYRNSFEGEPLTTISSLFFFLEHNELSPFSKPNNGLLESE